ncbi:hypothetical protein [Pseudomonas sp.]|uniref:hypothetical protein n=1 Tax=Pseudomonas sp. TaxID=306 RepID=UPI002912C000|nr:hypothetical protein [Pseudomonas sp.]MDU4254416.1 hypothetical protein [Pseudomonas sp.]
MTNLNQGVNAEELSRALAKQRTAKAVVAEAGSALVRGASTLVNALIQDTRTLIAKIPGNLTDQFHVHAHFATHKQLDAVFVGVEDFTGKTFPKTKEATTFLFSKFLGSSPADTFAMGSAIYGAGTVGRFVTNHLHTLVNDMSSSLTHVGFNGALGISNDSLVIGVLAVVGVSAMLLQTRYKPRLKAESFEQDREQQRAALEALAVRAGVGDLLPSEELANKFAKFKSKFDEDKKLSPETLADITAMRAAGASDLELSNRIGWSPDELRWAKPIYSRLTEEYLMTAPEAATIAHALIIDSDGDLPLIKKRLQSHVLPEEWTEKYDFKPDTFIGAVRFKDRPSELLKLGTAAVVGARQLFEKAASTMMERFGPEKNNTEAHVGFVQSNGTAEANGYQVGFNRGEEPTRWDTAEEIEYLRGYEAGVEDRELCDSMAAEIHRTLDGTTVASFGSFEAFEEHLDVTMAYEEMDADPDPEEVERTKRLLPTVYEMLLHSESLTATPNSKGSPRLG